MTSNVVLSDGAMTSPGQCSTIVGDQSQREAFPGGTSLEQQMTCLFHKTSSLEDQLRMTRRDRTEAEHRNFRLNEQMDRLWQEIQDERRERQVEANEERMTRQAEAAELRNNISRPKPRLLEFKDGAGLETFVEEPDEPEDEQAPELTALNGEEDGKARQQSRVSDAASSACVSEASLAAARHAEAQLKRAAADARRAEAMVRREVTRSLAEARTFLEDSSQQRQDIWAAKQKAAERAASGNTEDTKNRSAQVSVECLSLRLDSLEMHVRARLEAAESIQNSIDDIQNMPAQVGRLISAEIEGLRKEFEVAMTEERARGQNRAQAMVRDLMREIERSIVDQAVAEVRSEVSEAAQSGTSLLREELSRSRSDEASRQGMRIHALEERISSLECMSSRTRIGEEIGSAGSTSNHADSFVPDQAPAVALQQFGESVAQLESTIGGLLRKTNEQRTEYQADILKLRRDMEENSRRVSHLSAFDVGELEQRLAGFEDRLRRSNPWRETAEVASSRGDGLALRVVRLEQALEQQSSYVRTSKICVAEVLHRLSCADPDAAKQVAALYPEIATKDAERAGSAARDRAASEELAPAKSITIRAHSQGGSMVQLPTGYGTPSGGSHGGSMALPAGHSNSLQRRLAEPVASPGAPNYPVPVESAVMQSSSWSQAVTGGGGRTPSQPPNVQRSWSVPMARSAPSDHSVSATVKVVPPHLGATGKPAASSPVSPVQSQRSVTPFSQSLAAPSVSSLQLRPRAASPQQPAHMVQSNIRAGPGSAQQKPTDSPYMRYRTVKLPVSSSNLPGWSVTLI